MNIALIVLASVLSVIAMASATAKFTRRSDIIATLDRIGVPSKAVPLLGVLEVLGALGLFVGIWSKPLGVAAAAGLTIYFAGAVLAHVKIKDSVKDITPALGVFVLATATLVLELAR